MCKHTKEFCSAWAEKLAASNINLHFNQEMWLEEPKKESVDKKAVSAGRFKILVELLQDVKREEDGEYWGELWQQLKGRRIMSGETQVD